MEFLLVVSIYAYVRTYILSPFSRRRIDVIVGGVAAAYCCCCCCCVLCVVFVVLYILYSILLTSI
jgi:hypothetical protein